MQRLVSKKFGAILVHTCSSYFLILLSRDSSLQIRKLDYLCEMMKFRPWNLVLMLYVLNYTGNIFARNFCTYFILNGTSINITWSFLFIQF